MSRQANPSPKLNPCEPRQSNHAEEEPAISNGTNLITTERENPCDKPEPTQTPTDGINVQQ
jgi:hypothetical protein